MHKYGGGQEIISVIFTMSCTIIYTNTPMRYIDDYAHSTNYGTCDDALIIHHYHYIIPQWLIKQGYSNLN